MSETSKRLLLLQIGPVQEFITAARTIGDLWSGSYFIAHLIASGIKYVTEQKDCKIIFPCLEHQAVYERLTKPALDPGQPTLPNRFCAEVPATEAEKIAKGAEKAIQDTLNKISEKCFQKFLQIFPESGMRYKDRWQNQVESFLQIFWQVIDLDESNWGKSYGALLSNLAARRNSRNFLQFAVDSEPTTTSKDALNGKDEIIGDFEEWKKVLKEQRSPLSQDDRPYGAINFIKRVWRECYLNSDNAKQTTVEELIKESNGEAEKYIAAIQMDGDRMGSILSSKTQKPEFFTRFSKKIANFTRERAKDIVETHKGILVYAGGDDVLALLPACYAIQCAQDLREAFCEDDPDMPGSEKNLAEDVAKVTLSAGVSFCHYKTPLSWLLQGARAAEHRAKEYYDRDALTLSIYKRSGEILLWGAKFDSPAWKLFHLFANLDRDEVLSGRFASALAMYLKKYALEELNSDKDLFRDIIAADFADVCKKQKNPNSDNPIPPEFNDYADKYLNELLQSEDPASLAEFPQLFLAANFLIRKGENNV